MAVLDTTMGKMEVELWREEGGGCFGWDWRGGIGRLCFWWWEHGGERVVVESEGRGEVSGSVGRNGASEGARESNCVPLHEACHKPNSTHHDAEDITMKKMQGWLALA